MKRFLILCALLLAPAFVIAQEHPEHPEETKEKPKHSYTMDELAKAITADIEATQQKNGGVYTMKDDQKTWSMKLDHVHRERLAQIDPKTYFACTDFKSDDGHTVDVDFFMKDDGEKLVMSDASLHKVDGKARYNWKEKDGFWIKEPVN
ncbi:MAG TPA: hypothetical protein VLV78_23525 [Thermoanaerobaculia bacterium]|nr:hypothetical protein [Thermoanaerobaculia bacterium]